MNETKSREGNALLVLSIDKRRLGDDVATVHCASRCDEISEKDPHHPPPL